MSKIRARLSWFVHHYTPGSGCKAWHTVGVYLIFDALMKLHLIQPLLLPDGANIYCAHYVLDILLGISNITMKVEDMFPALKEYPSSRDDR